MIDDEDIFGWIDEVEKKYPFDVDMAFESLNEQYRQTIENSRRKRQTSMFNHDHIKNYIADNLKKVFPGYKLVGKEVTLINGRIDLLTKDPDENTCGIELKKNTLHTDYEQFLQYHDELEEIYGNDARLIILSSSYQGKFLKLDCSHFELWRYEIFWERFVSKKKERQYSIKQMKAIPYDKDSSYIGLFASELYKINRG